MTTAMIQVICNNIFNLHNMLETGSKIHFKVFQILEYSFNRDKNVSFLMADDTGSQAEL